MGLSSYAKGMAIFTLFGLALFMFMIQFIGLNNPSSPVVNDTNITNQAASFQANLNNFSQSVSSAKGLLNQGEPLPLQFAFLIFKGAFYIPQLFLSTIILGANVFTGGIFTQLAGVGSSPLYFAFNLAVAVMLMVGIFLIVRFIRTGQE